MSPKKGTISVGNTSSNHWFSGDMLVFRGVLAILQGKPTQCLSQFVHFMRLHIYKKKHPNSSKFLWKTSRLTNNTQNDMPLNSLKPSYFIYSSFAYVIYIHSYSEHHETPTTSTTSSTLIRLLDLCFIFFLVSGIMLAFRHLPNLNPVNGG